MSNTLFIQPTSTLLSDPLAQQLPCQSKQGSHDSQAGRVLLARTFGMDCLDALTFNAMGKPYFDAPHLPFFNLSHSRGLVALATCQEGEIGVDMEVIRPRKTIPLLSERYFNKEENQHIQQATPDQHTALFWLYWTAHEAVLKQESHSVLTMKPYDTLPNTLAEKNVKLLSFLTADYAISVCLPMQVNLIVPEVLVHQEIKH